MSVYRALARKYRSRHFGELIGQPALVRTLSNAIEQDRLHHAYMFTGIRGTGKTSTARILAKAINYAGPNGDKGPTTGPTDDCPICVAIGEDRHPDVIEIDAASNTGVDDVRQIIENVRYAPSQARYKVFIIDEVHMLSRQAFNALLKTLEEPPPHVVFMLATTEIRKVPTTILSRCQRFDLRRIDVPVLVEHFKNIAVKESVIVEDDALYLIAQAADGSARDGLSIFDQAIAQVSSVGEQQPITAQLIREMLGQANAGEIAAIFSQLMLGDIAGVLQKLEILHRAGTDPSAFLDDLLTTNHLVTRLKVTPALANDKTQNSLAMSEAVKLAEQFSLSALARVWQMLLKAVPEVANAPQPQQALEMALIRVGFAAPLPPLEELLRKTEGSVTGGNASAAPSAPSPSAPVARRFTTVSSNGSAAAAAAVMQVSETPQAELAAVASSNAPMENLMDLIRLLEDHQEMMLAADLYANVRVVRFAPNGEQGGQLQICVLPGAARDLASALPKALQKLTGQRWLVSIAASGGGPTMREQELAAKNTAIENAYTDPSVIAFKTVFPDIKITDLQTEQ